MEIIEKKIEYSPIIYIGDINENNIDKYIKKIEKLIRGSFEYRNYISYIKNELEIKNCAFLRNINEPKLIDIHHYPLTLFDISEIVLNKHIEEKSQIDIFIIANEIVELHYMNYIGLIPISKTVHQLFHKNEESIHISLNQVFGNFIKFLELYKKYLNERMINKLKHVLMSENKYTTDYTPEKLEIIITTLNLT